MNSNADNSNRDAVEGDLGEFFKRQFEESLNAEPPIEQPDDPLDRRYFVLNAEDFDRLVELLDNPPEPSEGLRRLMAATPSWERGD